VAFSAFCHAHVLISTLRVTKALRPCWMGLFERPVRLLVKIRFTQKQYQFWTLKFFYSLLDNHSLTGCAQLSNGVSHVGAFEYSRTCDEYIGPGF
jgi:hypothetical protein